jgi:hypothetical protein
MGDTLPPPTASTGPFSGRRSWRVAGLSLILTAVAVTTGVTTSARMARSGPAAPRSGAVGPVGASAPDGSRSAPLRARSPVPNQPRPSGSAATATVGGRVAPGPQPAPSVPTVPPGRPNVVARPPAAEASATVHQDVATAAALGAGSVAASPAAVHQVAAPVPASTPASPCAKAIAAVEGRGLFPAAGFGVVCPGSALGHEGMTCMNEAAICPGMKEIVIHDPQPFVVANEFENSRIFSGSPARCDVIDCGGAAYGY